MPLKWLAGTALLGSGRRSVTGVRAPAVSCLTRDTGALLRFFDVPAAHRDPLRTSIRLRASSPPSAIAQRFGIAPCARSGPCRKKP